MAEDVFKNVQILKEFPTTSSWGRWGSSPRRPDSTAPIATSTRAAATGRIRRRQRPEADHPTHDADGVAQHRQPGRQVVTCNTCHRGTRQPNVMPSIALLYGTPPPDEPGEPFTQVPGQPPPDQVLDKYLQAVGGAQRLRRSRPCRQRGIRFRRVRKEPDRGGSRKRQASERQSSTRCLATARRLTTAGRAGSRRRKQRNRCRCSR